MSRIRVIEIIRRGPMGPPGDMDSAEWLAWQEAVNSKANAADVTSALATKVSKTGDEAIDGTKTFNASPVVPEPTADKHAVSKDYVDPRSVPLGGKPGQILVKQGALDGDAIWVYPDTEIDPTRTLSVVGDLHIGYGSSPEQQSAAVARMDETFNDLATLDGLYARRIYVGDLIELPTTTGTTPSSHDTEFLARANALDDDWLAVAGNHDTNSTRTSEDWAVVYGFESPNYTRNLGFCRIIAIASEGPSGTSSEFTPATLAFLDDELAADSRDTIVLSHYPLYGTVDKYVQPDGTWWGYHTFGNYLTSGGHARPDADIRAILNDHPHARVWLCGHSHSPLVAPDLFKQEWLGDRYISVINAGAPVYTYATEGALYDDDPFSLFLTLLPDRLEIRVRNHRHGFWEGYDDALTYPMWTGISNEIAPGPRRPSAIVSFGNETPLIVTDDPDTEVTLNLTPSYETVGGITGVSIEKASANRIGNPVFHENVSSMAADNGTLSHSTAWSFTGPGSAQIVASGANAAFRDQLTVPAREFVVSAVVKNDAAGSRTFRITADGTPVSDDLVLAAGEVGRVLGHAFTGSGTVMSIRILCPDSQGGDVLRMGHIQLEEQPEPTSPIPLMDENGNPLPGFSFSEISWWHREFSITVPAADVVTIPQGSVVVRARFLNETDGSSNWLAYHYTGSGGTIVRVGRLTSGTARGTIGSDGANASGHTDLGDTDMHTLGISWRGRRLKLYVDGRLEGTGDGSLNAISSLADLLKIGFSGDVVIYDALTAKRELTGAEHAALHAATTNWTAATLDGLA